MTKTENPKQYDLEERTLNFAKRVRRLVKNLKISTINIEDGKQLVRSSGSVGANYIEANEALSKKDFLLRIKICRKEAKETTYWLQLLVVEGPKDERERRDLLQEAKELMMIFSAIMRKSM